MEEKNRSLISVIMPVYNARQYIEKAIESVLKQSYAQLELVLVDDGATDGSGEICDRYAKQDSRIIVIHQKNGGISSARNRGLQVVKGKYIAFCDHDDEMLPHCLENALLMAESKHGDMVKFTYQHDRYSFGKRVGSSSQCLPDTSYKMSDLINHYDLFSAAVRVLWNGLYITNIIKSNEISFDESVRFGMEDFLFNLKYMEYVKSVTFLSSKGYIHYDRYEQSTDEKYDENKLFAREKAAIAEKTFLKKMVMKQSNWIYHQITYLTLYLATLNHPMCKLTFREKNKRLKELNSPEKFGLCCSRVYCLTLFRSPKQMLISILFNYRLYSLLLWVYSTFSQRYKRFTSVVDTE